MFFEVEIQMMIVLLCVGGMEGESQQLIAVVVADLQLLKSETRVCV